MGNTPPRRKHGRKVLIKAKKRKLITNVLHVNTNESKFLKSSNIDCVQIRTTSYFTTLEYAS